MTDAVAEFQPYWIVFNSHAAGLIVRKVKGPENDKPDAWMLCEEIARTAIATHAPVAKNTFYRMPVSAVEEAARYDTEELALAALSLFGQRFSEVVDDLSRALRDRLDFELALRSCGTTYLKQLREHA